MAAHIFATIASFEVVGTRKDHKAIFKIMVFGVVALPSGRRIYVFSYAQFHLFLHKTDKL